MGRVGVIATYLYFRPAHEGGLSPSSRTFMILSLTHFKSTWRNQRSSSKIKREAVDKKNASPTQPVTRGSQTLFHAFSLCPNLITFGPMRKKLMGINFAGSIEEQREHMNEAPDFHDDETNKGEEEVVVVVE